MIVRLKYIELLHFQEKQLYQNCLVSFSKWVSSELLTAELKWNCYTVKESNSIRIV